MGELMDLLNIQIAFALPERQFLRSLRVAEGTTLQQAIHQSGLLEEFPDANLSTCKIGIFGKLRDLDTVLRDRDRVEIYRSLIADPKEARRRRAAKKERAPR